MKTTLGPHEDDNDEVGWDGDPLHRRPPSRTLEWVARSIDPQAAVIGVRRLTEGHWHANHVITVRNPGGREHELVLRRWARPGWKSEDPDFTPDREATVLELLARSSVPTPTLVAVDTDGSSCDVPAMLTDKLPGSHPGQPENLDIFVRQLADALPEIHAVDDGARILLPPYRRYYDNLTSVKPPPWARQPALWQRAAAVVAEQPPPAASCLIHRDYHPGNTLWTDERLTGVVDWTQGSWGPPAVDTAHMRWNLAASYGPDVAEAFLDHYRTLSTATQHDQHYWDVVTLLDVLPDLPPDDLPPHRNDRLESYLDSVLQHV